MKNYCIVCLNSFFELLRSVMCPQFPPPQMVDFGRKKARDSFGSFKLLFYFCKNSIPFTFLNTSISIEYCAPIKKSLVWFSRN